MAAAADAEDVQKVPDWVMQCVEMIWEECEKISPGKEVHTIEDVKKASDTRLRYALDFASAIAAEVSSL